METLLEIGISNAVMAVILASIAAGVSAVARRPALTHALWWLVLLKLVTPPVVRVPTEWLTPWPSGEIAHHIEEHPAATASPSVPRLTNESRVPTSPAATLLDAPAAASRSNEPTVTEPASLLARAGSSTTNPPVRPLATWPSWPTTIMGIWLGGSALWMVVLSARVLRFSRLLRYAQAAPPELQKRTQRLAEKMGIRRVPPVCLVPGVVPPMLWATAGGPRLILPSELWSRLDHHQQTTLLLHELAHLRRRDHWVRVLELVATGLYWWHPVAWWARREIRISEELCCDAWVLWTRPGSGQTYATALLETVDFLSEWRPALPLLASGVGPMHVLKRRITMIVDGTTRRSLSPAGKLAVLALSIALLPLVPAWAQDEPRGKELDKREQIELLHRKIKMLRDAGRQEEVEKAERRIREIEAQLGGSSDPARRPHERLESFERHIDELRSAGREEEAEELEQHLRRLLSDRERHHPHGPDRPHDVPNPLEHMMREIGRLMIEGHIEEAERLAAEARAMREHFHREREQRHHEPLEEHRERKERFHGPRPDVEVDFSMGGPPLHERVSHLERMLESVLHEVEGLRQELQQLKQSGATEDLFR